MLVPYNVAPTGGLAEWSIAAVLKTADRKVRGFESLTLRHSAAVVDKALSSGLLVRVESKDATCGPSGAADGRRRVEPFEV